MRRSLLFLAFFAIAIFLIDQAIKQIFIDGFRWNGDYFSLILTYNKGVAFSMFAFLGQWLKYIQLALILGVFFYVLANKELLTHHAIAFGIIIGAGCGNIYDRFVHEGVVDYIFWHKWFEFAVFNFADVMINFAVALILLQTWLLHVRKSKN